MNEWGQGGSSHILCWITKCMTAINRSGSFPSERNSPGSPRESSQHRKTASLDSSTSPLPKVRSKPQLRERWEWCHCSVSSCLSRTADGLPVWLFAFLASSMCPSVSFAEHLSCFPLGFYCSVGFPCCWVLFSMLIGFSFMNVWWWCLIFFFFKC